MSSLISCGPIFSAVVKGNLLIDKLILKLPTNQLQKGVWQLALDSFSYVVKEFKEEKKYLCGLKCNWITSINYNANHELITESPFLFQFLISKSEDCIPNNKTWFEINSLSEFLVCEIFDLQSNEILNIDCSVFFLFHFQRKL